LLAHFGLERAGELIHAVYREDFGPRTVAGLARYVQQSRDEGDAVASAILSRAGEELIAAATAVMTRLELTPQQFSFVLAGGMFRAVPSLAEQLELRLPSVAPRSHTIRLESEPALGAVQLAVAELHGGARLAAYRPTLE
jgi:N-acetylglucosamine kinase-like BadF-type ATPase